MDYMKRACSRYLVAASRLGRTFLQGCSFGMGVRDIPMSSGSLHMVVVFFMLVGIRARKVPGVTFGAVICRWA